MPTRPRFPDLPPDYQQRIAQLSLKEQQDLVGVHPMTIRKIIDTMVFGGAIADTVALTPEEQAMRPEEFVQAMVKRSQRMAAEQNFCPLGLMTPAGKAVQRSHSAQARQPHRHRHRLSTSASAIDLGTQWCSPACWWPA
jgi:hypothetical protein